MKTIIQLINNEDGAVAIEYGLLAALIAVAAIFGMTTVGTKVKETLEAVTAALTIPA